MTVQRVSAEYALRRWPKLMASLAALAAGAGTAETGETPAQSEGRQSGAESATPNPPTTSSNQSDGRGL